MLCLKCGKENGEDAMFCQGCGTQLNDDSSQQLPPQYYAPPQQQFQQPMQQQPYYPPPTRKPEKPLYKRVWFWLIVVFIGIPVLSGIVGGGNDSKPTAATATTSNSANVSGKDESLRQEKPIAVEGEGDIDKYHVVIKGIELAEDYAGKPAVVVTYEWTNNSDESKAFGYTLDETVYQDGIECESSIIKIVTDDSDGKYKEIKPGKTLEFRYGYLLNDTTTPIEVEVGPWMSFSNPPIVSKTFEIE